MGYFVPIVRRPDPKAELGYVCPECKQWAPVGLWKEAEVSCELCGDHSAKQCPLCGEAVDTLYSDFEDPDDFLKADAAKAGSPSGILSPEVWVPAPPTPAPPQWPAAMPVSIQEVAMMRRVAEADPEGKCVCAPQKSDRTLEWLSGLGFFEKVTFKGRTAYRLTDRGRQVTMQAEEKQA